MLPAVAEWFSIEVFDGASSAQSWADVHGDSVIFAAQEHGLTDWSWHRHAWGVVLELELPDEATWERFQEAAAVRAALDAVPDPVGGLILYRGRGGSSGTRQPRKPKPFAGAGAVALPFPVEDDMAVVGPAAPRRQLVLCG
jgi:hypothetical protein